MQTMVVVAAVGVLVAAAGYIAWEQFGAASDCEGEPMAAVRAAPGTFHFKISLQNNVSDDPIRICMFDEGDAKLFDQTFAVTGEVGASWEFDLARAPDRWIADMPGSDNYEHSGLGWYLSSSDCAGERHDFVFSYKYKLMSLDCVGTHPPPFAVRQGQQSQVMGVAPETSLGPPPPATGMALAAGGGALLVLLLRFRHHLQWAFLAFFSRIAAPRVLDSSVRSHIHQLVVTEPGIRRFEIAQRLELAPGQTVHHLRVLVREHVLSEVGRGFGKHYFVRGQFAPDRMRQLAILRNASVAAVWRLVQQHPGSPLSRIAERAGYSMGRVSKIVRQLTDLRLVRGDRSGKQLLLFPADATHPAAS